MSGYTDRMEPNRNHEIQHSWEEEESQLREFFKFINEYFELEQKAVEIQKFAGDHPLASVFLIVTLAMCSIPIILFALFLFGSFVVGLLGFLFVEGTALAIGTVVLGGTLFIIALVSVGFSIFLICGYYAVSMSGSMLGAVRGKLASMPFISNESEVDIYKEKAT